MAPLTRTAHIVGGGNPPRADWIYQAMEEADLLICADSGADALWKRGLIPHVVCGDLDSISDEARRGMEAQNVTFRTFPVQKDQTDTELAVGLALEAGMSDLELSGMDGGRVDHLLANYLLGLRYGRKCRLRILGEQHRAWVVTSDLHFAAEPGQVVSVIPLEDCQGVWLQGLAYPLENGTLIRGTTLGNSNAAATGDIRVRLAAGMALVVHSW